MWIPQCILTHSHSLPGRSKPNSEVHLPSSMVNNPIYEGAIYDTILDGKGPFSLPVKPKAEESYYATISSAIPPRHRSAKSEITRTDGEKLTTNYENFGVEVSTKGNSTDRPLTLAHRDNPSSPPAEEESYMVMSPVSPCHKYLPPRQLDTSLSSTSSGGCATGPVTVQFGRLSISSSDNSRYVVAESTSSDNK